jgi:hypothetical protein
MIPEQMGKLFQEFSHASSIMGSKYGGTGLVPRHQQALLPDGAASSRWLAWARQGLAADRTDRWSV